MHSFFNSRGEIYFWNVFSAAFDHQIIFLRSDPDVCENDNQWMTNRGSMVDVAKFINFLLVFCDKKCLHRI
jgi:hypothetical protein